MKLPETAVKCIETWRLGFLATVSPDGKPNVSPKGTFIVVDEETIAFGEMRSPNTVRNLSQNREVEVNFVDTLTRRGTRIRGQAQMVGKDEERYKDLLPYFLAIWGEELCAMFNQIIVIPVGTVKPLQSPIYEVGGNAEDLKALWKSKIAEL